METAYSNEQWTALHSRTLRASPSASILHKPAHWPSCLASGTDSRLTFFSAHSASMSFL